MSAHPIEIPRPSLVGGPGFYFTGDDHLRLTSWNSVTSAAITLTGRFLHLDGHIEPFSERHVPNTDRTPATSTFRRAEGWLLDLSASVSGARSSSASFRPTRRATSSSAPFNATSTRCPPSRSATERPSARGTWR